jgi:two-component system response regulator HydG
LAPSVTAADLERSLESPLRLRLVADLLDRDPDAISLEEAVVASSRHYQDVVACLRPMVRWEVLEELSGERFALRKDLPAEYRDALQRGIDARRDLLERERRVRYTVLAGMIGTNPKMQLVFEMIRQVCRLDVPVLITGETGTGKELVARAIHDLGPRRAKTFGAINCATLRESLVESQLFGHARGSFTGAVRDHVGLVEQCNGGTLFLDEVGDLELANQVKLLRVLQEGTFNRLGETTLRRSDFRLVAATNRDLITMVASGRFREDLYYRLNVFPIRLPSLRERLDDLPHLVAEIIRNSARLGLEAAATTVSAEALAVLGRHSWPGHVRELENVVARAAIMARGQPIRPEHLPPLDAGRPARPVGLDDDDDLGTLAEVERKHIAKVLQATAGNIRSTAQILGVTRATVYKKIAAHGLDELVRTERKAGR